MRNKKHAFSLIEILLTLSITALLLVTAFFVYNKITDKMLIRDQLKFTDILVLTTRDIYKNNVFKFSDESSESQDAIIEIFISNNPNFVTAEVNEDHSMLKTPLLESINIIGGNDFDDNGKDIHYDFIFQPQYPIPGMYSQSRCIDLANEYIGRYGNIMEWTGDIEESIITNQTPNKQEKIIKFCDQYNDESYAGGIGFGF